MKSLVDVGRPDEVLPVLEGGMGLLETDDEGPPNTRRVVTGVAFVLSPSVTSTSAC